jgi:hypothetical protein
MNEDQKAILALTKKVEDLEAENQRLREALQEIADNRWFGEYDPSVCTEEAYENVVALMETAKDALEASDG